MGKPEGTIENYLRQLCQNNGILYYKFTSPGHAGVPDRIVIGYGKVIFVELKRPGGKPRALQEHVFQQMRQAGATVIVIDTKEKAAAFVAALRKD